VIAGQYGGLRLATLAGTAIRPTGDRMKEAWFSILGPGLEGARVLDAFAGTGSLGIEALSRGAAEVVFLEKGERARALIRANLALLRDPPPTRILAGDACRPSSWGGVVLPVDLILADPPYGEGLVEAFLGALDPTIALTPEGSIMVEHPASEAPEAAGWKVTDRRRYGTAALSRFAVA
jgi:16S rRNA (guanine966-N2)-methyltransferase